MFPQSTEFSEGWGGNGDGAFGACCGSSGDNRGGGSMDCWTATGIYAGGGNVDVDVGVHTRAGGVQREGVVAAGSGFSAGRQGEHYRCIAPASGGNGNLLSNEYVWRREVG